MSPTNRKNRPDVDTVQAMAGRRTQSPEDLQPATHEAPFGNLAQSPPTEQRES